MKKNCAHFPYKTRQMSVNMYVVLYVKRKSIKRKQQYISDFSTHRLRTPTIKSTETDWNRDGKLDWVDMTIEMPADDHQAIYGVQLYLLFDVKLYVSNTQGRWRLLKSDGEKYFWPITLLSTLHPYPKVFLSI